jgi:hypothetical protein
VFWFSGACALFDGSWVEEGLFVSFFGFIDLAAVDSDPAFLPAAAFRGEVLPSAVRAPVF